ncbi:MAG: proline--tRNA ligase [Myxococcota bacterium]|nr:proline--tRNA ligase [Myxococcota bacterium]MDW8363825.1 proline--tRNA ligase [Myxococcales bacterium]
MSGPPPRTAIEPTRAEDYAEWYQQVVRQADLADHAPVRGCMIIKPWGYALWENTQRALDGMFKATGHRNAYFPLFIPLSFLEKEAEHVEGFAKECAVVTHHRLVAGPEGGLVPDPEARLAEPLVVRPTSETIIGAAFAQWVQSYRDLPLLINQWANVVRWEMRTRLFLRTAEFLWQEGHTAHATEAEAREETARMLDVYRTFAEQWMAMPVVAGPKTDAERFPGAVETHAIEAMMQDRKALQAGTSHFLGQNFARASGIRFQAADGSEQYAWTTSWGVSTRLLGALVMTHGDDDGLVLPPRLAPAHVAVWPVLRDDADRARVLEAIEVLARALRATRWADRTLEVEVDLRDVRGPDKQWEWIRKGVPLRIEVGPRDLQSGTVGVARRDRPHRERLVWPLHEVAARVGEVLSDMQTQLLQKALAFRDAYTVALDDAGELEAFFTPRDAQRPEIHGGFALAHWCGGSACEQRAHAFKASIRVVPVHGIAAARAAERIEERGRCVFCGGPSPRRVLFAKAY